MGYKFLAVFAHLGRDYVVPSDYVVSAPNLDIKMFNYVYKNKGGKAHLKYRTVHTDGYACLCFNVNGDDILSSYGIAVDINSGLAYVVGDKRRIMTTLECLFYELNCEENSDADADLYKYLPVLFNKNIVTSIDTCRFTYSLSDYGMDVYVNASYLNPNDKFDSYAIFIAEKLLIKEALAHSFVVSDIVYDGIFELTSKVADSVRNLQGHENTPVWRINSGTIGRVVWNHEVWFFVNDCEKKLICILSDNGNGSLRAYTLSKSAAIYCLTLGRFASKCVEKDYDKKPDSETVLAVTKFLREHDINYTSAVLVKFIDEVLCEKDKSVIFELFKS